MFELILQSIWYLLPAGIANMMPPLFKKWGWFESLDTPIDEPLFGKNKTYRGILAAVLAGIIVFWIQKWLYEFSLFESISLFNYYDQTILLGFLLGLGAILGDLIKSFFKRRVGIAPGKPFIPFDQLDFVIGALLFSFLVYIPPLNLIITALIAMPILHILVNRIGYLLKITNKW